MINFLRAAVFNAWFYGISFVLAFVGIVVRRFYPDRALAFGQFWGRLVLGGLRVICGVYPVVTGRENIPAHGPALIASQHQSAFDTLVWLALAPRTCFVLKQELIKIPLFGPLLMQAGMIPVNRAAGAAALRKLLNDTAIARDANQQIVIFPEGTRAIWGAPLKLQPGIAAIANRMDMPVIPVATDSGRRWARQSFSKTPGPIHISIGPPIPRATPRNDLLAAIEAHWADAAGRGYREQG